MRRLASILFIALGIMLISASIPFCYFWYAFRHPPQSAPRSMGVNAMWARHQWVGAAHPAREYADLAALITRQEISDVFFHVGPLDGQGGIDPARLAHAGALLRAMHAQLPTVRLQAWVGAREKRGGGTLELADRRVLSRIVSTSSALLDLGFDGIHYNIEPLYSGDRHFLELLERTLRVTRGRGKVLSVAVDELEPFPGAGWLAGLRFRTAGLWSGSYYQAVAARVDQVAVMMYDTTVSRDFLFSALVAWETWGAMRSVGDRVTVFMGVPTYDEPGPGHFPDAENMQSGLRGIRLGLSRAGPRARSYGAAIYAEWTTDSLEWQTYRREWLGR